MAAIAIDRSQLACRIGKKYSGGGGIPARTVDFFSNMAARTGWGTNSLPEATEYDLVRLSLNYWLMLTLYRNHWIMRKIVDVPSRDMVKAWPRVTSEMDPEDITRIDGVIRKTRLKSRLLDAIRWGKLFGGAGALIIIKGQEDQLDQPLKLDTIELGSFKGLIPFDRWSGINPGAEIETDIEHPLRFNLPKYYDVWSANGGSSFHVHSSRILRFVGPPVPQPELQAQSYWGISVYEPVYEELRKRDNMSWNILNLTFRANLIGMRNPELAQMLSGLSMNSAALQRYQSSMNQMNSLMSNQSLMVLPKDGEMSAVNYSFGGVSDVYQQFQLDVAGAAEIPVTRLYGRTMTGIGQTNDADEQIYEDRIASEQDEQLRPQLEHLYAVLCASTLGEVPDDIDLQFPSIRVLDPKEKAELAKSNADTITGYVNSGLFSKALALKEIKQTSDITEIGTNISDEDIAAAEEEEKAEALVGGDPGETEVEGEPDGGAGSHELVRAADALTPRTWHGLELTIEQPAKSQRTIKNADGYVVYDRLLQYDYGFINGTVGRDGDEVDVIVGPDMDVTTVYVASMLDLGPDVYRREDEDKVLIGFATERAARDAFLTMYPPEFLEDIRPVSLDNFKKEIHAKI